MEPMPPPVTAGAAGAGEGVAQSGLVVPVAAATATVAPWRERLDPAAVHGVPAHVTVLFPFAPPASIGPVHLQRLSHIFSMARPFDFALTGVGWFGETVVYLTPEPAAPFVALTERVVAAFPEHPPYEGEFDAIVPHLTIGDRGSPVELRRAAAAVAPALPIHARATEVWLMVGAPVPGAWQVRTRFPLGGVPRG
jgi:2'-5' RNA ligase